MNQYSRSVGSSSSSSQVHVSSFSSPLPLKRVGKSSSSSSSSSIPFSPIRKNLILQDLSNHDDDDDDDDGRVPLKSGEEAITYLGERAFFLETFLKCLAKVSNTTTTTSTTTTTRGSSSSTSSSTSSPTDDDIIKRVSIINYCIKESRKLLHISINSVMKGHDDDATMIGSVFSAISAIGTMPVAHSLMFLLTHITATISYSWSNHLKLQLAYQKLSTSTTTTTTSSSPLTLQLFKQDAQLLLHTVSILINRVTVDPFLSSDYLKIFINSTNTTTTNTTTKNSTKKRINNDLSFEPSTVEDSFKNGPIQQWIRLWQHLIISITDIIKGGHSNGFLDNDTMMHDSLINALSSLCLLERLCQDDDVHRPELALLCLDGEHQAVNLMKRLLDVASSLPLNDTYEKSRHKLLHTCFHLMKHLAHDPIDNPFDLKLAFFSLLDSLVYTTLQMNGSNTTTTSSDSIEKYCPSISLILKAHNYHLFETSPEACATVMKSLYALMNMMISNDYHDRIFDSNDRIALFILQQELKRKYKALRLYVCSRLYCKHHPFQLDDYSNIDTSAVITVASFSRFANLFASAGLQVVLPIIDKSTPSSSSLSLNIWDSIDKILNEIIDITKSGRGLDLLVDICLFKNHSTLYLPHRKDSSNLKSVNDITEFAVDPLDDLGYAHLGNQHLFNLCVRSRELLASNKNDDVEFLNNLSRTILSELQLSGEWEIALRLIDILLNDTNEIHDLQLKKHILSERKRVKESLEEHLREDSLKRPFPIYYAVRFSVSPFETADILEKSNLTTFVEATFCASNDYDNNHNNNDLRFGESGTWLLLRVDPTAFVGGASLYSSYADYKHANKGVDIPAFLPPQSYNFIEYLMSVSFPNFCIISNSSNEFIGENRNTRAIQIFHAHPADICDELYGHR